MLFRSAWSVEAALEEIRSQSERQFDPGVVNALFELLGLAVSEEDFSSVG